MTQDLYQKAMKFAGEKHKEQKVPGTAANYLLHLANVAMEILVAYIHDGSFDLDLAVQTAILHDVIEDTDTDFEEVESLFGVQVAHAVLALTKSDSLPSKQEKMKDSLIRINQLSPEVGMVKLADRITNLQEPPDYWTREKRTRYVEEAKLIAEKLTGKHAYLNARLQQKIEEYQI